MSTGEPPVGSGLSVRVYVSPRANPGTQTMFGVSRSHVISRENWNHGWLYDYSVTVAFFTAGIPIQVANSLFPVSDLLSGQLSVVAACLLYGALFVVLVLAVGVVDGQYSGQFPTVTDPTPNFRAGLIPAAVVGSWVLVGGLGQVLLGESSPEVALGVLWAVVGNGIAFLACLLLARQYARRYN